MKGYHCVKKKNNKNSLIRNVPKNGSSGKTEVTRKAWCLCKNTVQCWSMVNCVVV